MNRVKVSMVVLVMVLFSTVCFAQEAEEICTKQFTEKGKTQLGEEYLFTVIEKECVSTEHRVCMKDECVYTVEWGLQENRQSREAQRRVDYGDESKYVLNDCKIVTILNPSKTFDQRFMSNMLGNKLKYKTDTSWTTEALDVDDRTSSDNDKDVTNSKFLYSMALVHEITVANVVALFYPRMTRQEQANYYLGPFRLQSFKLINEGAYSNTLTNQFAEGQSIPIETNETLKYAITGKFEGCIGDLLNEFKIGCVSRDTSSDSINNNRVEIAQTRCLINNQR